MDEEALKELRGMREDFKSAMTAMSNNQNNELLQAILATQGGLTINADKVVAKVETPAPEVTVTPEINIHLPEQQVPEVTVEAAKQAPPVINVNIPKQDPPIVNNEIKLPSRIRERKKVNRNRQGLIETIDGETILED